MTTTTQAGVSLPCGAGKGSLGCSIPLSATSVFTRPTRLRAGGVADFLRKRGGNAFGGTYLQKETCSTQADCIRQKQAVSASSNCSAIAGSGRPARTQGTRVISHLQGRLASTTASLRAVRWSYVEDSASRLRFLQYPVVEG